MIEARWLSRVHLRSDASVSALKSVLLQHSGSTHALIWSLFADGPDRKRDFLYRQVNFETQSFYILSARKPEDKHNFFEIDAPKPFEPVLRKGDRLQFLLHANPVVSKTRDDKKHSSRHDVVMDALNSVSEKGKRKEHRSAELEWEAGYKWLSRQGERVGFRFEIDQKEKLRVDGYQQHRIPRGKGQNLVRFSTLDFEGELTVENPESFLNAVYSGFGKARAWGCGLMLIRRAARN